MRPEHYKVMNRVTGRFQRKRASSSLASRINLSALGGGMPEEFSANGHWPAG